MVLKTIVIDDEPLAVNVLRNYIENIEYLQLVHTFSNAVDAQSFVQNNVIDIIFLDIDMPLLNGLDFLRNIKMDPQVIITTAHEKYALQGYELEIVDYLIKPIPFPRFLKSINRVLKLKQIGEKSLGTPQKSSHIFVKIDKKKLQKIYFDEIIVVESLKDYIRIVTGSSKYIVHRTLSSFTEELPSDQFIRIHRSFTVSIDKVEAIEGNSLQIQGAIYTIGRSYLLDVKSTILNGAKKTD